MNYFYLLVMVIFVDMSAMVVVDMMIAGSVMSFCSVTIFNQSKKDTNYKHLVWKSWHVYHVFRHCCIPFINFLDLKFQIDSFTGCLMWKSCSFVFYCKFWDRWNFAVHVCKIMISIFVPLEMVFIVLPNFPLVSFSVVKEIGQVFLVEIDCPQVQNSVLLLCQSNCLSTILYLFQMLISCIFWASTSCHLRAFLSTFSIPLICGWSYILFTATFLAILYSTKYCSMCNTFCGKFGS